MALEKEEINTKNRTPEIIKIRIEINEIETKEKLKKWKIQKVGSLNK